MLSYTVQKTNMRERGDVYTYRVEIVQVLSSVIRLVTLFQMIKILNLSNSNVVWCMSHSFSKYTVFS